MSPQVLIAIISLIEHVALGLRLGPKAKKEYALLSAKVRSLVDNDRDPSAEEWADLGRSIDSASSRLRAAAALLDE